jgi:hypothetical protein
MKKLDLAVKQIMVMIYQQNNTTTKHIYNY